MLHQMFYLEMAWENFQHAYLTLTPVWLEKMLSIHLVKCKNAYQWIDFYSVDPNL